MKNLRFYTYEKSGSAHTGLDDTLSDVKGKALYSGQTTDHDTYNRACTLHYKIHFDHYFIRINTHTFSGPDVLQGASLHVFWFFFLGGGGGGGDCFQNEKWFFSQLSFYQ